jgi:hypothetical protein
VLGLIERCNLNRGGGVPAVLGPLGVNLEAVSKGPNRLGVSPPPSEDGNRTSFRNVVFSSF